MSLAKHVIERHRHHHHIIIVKVIIKVVNVITIMIKLKAYLENYYEIVLKFCEVIAQHLKNVWAEKNIK